MNFVKNNNLLKNKRFMIIGAVALLFLIFLIIFFVTRSPLHTLQGTWVVEAGGYDGGVFTITDSTATYSKISMATKERIDVAEYTITPDPEHDGFFDLTDNKGDDFIISRDDDYERFYLISDSAYVDSYVSFIPVDDYNPIPTYEDVSNYIDSFNAHKSGPSNSDTSNGYEEGSDWENYDYDDDGRISDDEFSDAWSDQVDEFLGE